MGERDAFEAREAAKQELTAHPERPWQHEGAIGTYLAGFAYTESSPPADRPEHREQPAQPLDEPASAVDDRAPRDRTST
jgi:hypothetical protein